MKLNNFCLNRNSKKALSERKELFFFYLCLIAPKYIGVNIPITELIEKTVTSVYVRLSFKNILTRIEASGKATIVTIRLILAFFMICGQLRLL